MQQNNQKREAEIWIEAAKAAKSTVKQLDKKVFKDKKNLISVPKGTQYDWLNNTSYNNVIYPKDKIPDNLLRLVEKRNGIVGSIVTLAIQQSMEFSHVSHDRDVPGWEVVLKDNKATLNSTQKKQKEFLENLIMNTKRDDYESPEPHDATFRDLITSYSRDRILIDKITWEIERDKKGETVALHILDGASILPVLPGGFYGSTAQIGTGMFGGYTKLSDEIRKAKLDQVPPLEEVRYIQELIYGSSGGGITAAFSDRDIIYDLGNELNDIRYYKQGLSVVEKANIAVVAFINSITFNSNGLSRGSIPKVAIAMGKDQAYTEEQLEDMQDEWMANFESMDGQWNIPLLNGDAKVLNMLPNNRDMEYQKYMEFTGALICSICGVDSAELGLRLNQAQAVLSENSDGKQIFSKNRAVRERLGGFAYIMNRWIEKSGYEFAKDFVFRFNGLSTEDKSFEADLKKKKVETYMTVNEIRAEEDLKPVENGDIILNTVFMQAKQGAEQAAMGEGMEGEGGEDEGFGGFSDEETDDLVEEAMGKAIKLI